MKSLYACIEINKKLNNTENHATEKVKYYKTKDELYGIQIVKDTNLQDKSLNVQNIAEITEDESEINKILDVLVNNMVMYNFEDIINDIIKNRICVNAS